MAAMIVRQRMPNCLARSTVLTPAAFNSFTDRADRTMHKPRSSGAKHQVSRDTTTCCHAEPAPGDRHLKIEPTDWSQLPLFVESLTSAIMAVSARPAY